MKKADLNFSFENYVRYKNLFNPHKLYLTRKNLGENLLCFLKPHFLFMWIDLL